MKKIALYYLLILLSCLACTQENDKNIEQLVEAFYQTFDERKEFEKFLSFYEDSVVLEDIINGDRIVGKEQLKNFFDWRNPDFKKLGPHTLVITNKIIDGNKAVVKGYFTPFEWGQTRFEAMHFTTILTFSDSNKIRWQTDWINYPSTLVNYNERKNSNLWIPK